MKEITIRDQDLGFSPIEGLNYRKREAARAVVLDQDGNTALLDVSNHGYHKIPGGGIESDEDIVEALKRECLEEIGCKVRIDGNKPIAIIQEYRDRLNLDQKSYCYLAYINGEKGNPNFTESEIKEGFKVVWLPLTEAIKIAQKDTPDSYEAQFMKKRDLIFLQIAQEILKER
jgi:8-oxo-dGTP pyrophosphatase MutT (NUDIX family)